MKRLLLSTLVLILATPVHAFGKYNSQVEAKTACKKWADKGFKYSFEKTEWTGRYEGYDYGGKAKLMTYEKTNRYCDYESSTNQYLGYEATKIKKGQHYKEYVYENMDKGLKIKKYFKF